MKFKVKHEKSNLIFMSSVIILCLVTCIFWLMLREYIYFIIYFLLTLIISHIYYFTNYYIKDNYLKIKLGFIKIKIQYEKMIKIENLEKSINLKFKNFDMKIYPNNKDIFYVELNNKMKGCK